MGQIEIGKELTEIAELLNVNIERKEMEQETISMNLYCGNNRIVFGAPGTGKSFGLNNEAKTFGDNMERVTFHPDYKYSNFVGSYKPVPKGLNPDDGITYKFVPGPFIRSLVEAIKHKDKPYLLLIEEINRAEVAAVFGDVFQLLDRDDNGNSRYPVNASEDVRNFFKTDDCIHKDNTITPEIREEFNNMTQISIPSNLYIWATMNSADQGVFPMDTAFKRRWEFEYVGINEGEYALSTKEVVFGSQKRQKASWNMVRRALNEFMSKTMKVNEDKLMGPFFLSKSLTSPDGEQEIDQKKFLKTFKTKVIMYLFEDAGRMNRAKLFKGCGDDYNSYSEICQKFDEIGLHIFFSGIEDKFKEYKLENVENPNGDVGGNNQ